MEHTKEIDGSQDTPTSEQMFEVARPLQMADSSPAQAVQAREDTATVGTGNGDIKPQGTSIWSYLGFR